MKYTKKKNQPTMPCEFFYSASFYSTMIDSNISKINVIQSYLMYQELTERHCNTEQQHINISLFKYTHSMKLLASNKSKLEFFFYTEVIN